MSGEVSPVVAKAESVRCTERDKSQKKLILKTDDWVARISYSHVSYSHGIRASSREGAQTANRKVFSHRFAQYSHSSHGFANMKCDIPTPP